MKTLEIVIGLVLIYFLYSLLCSIIVEMFSTWMGLRARHLRQGIENLLNDRKSRGLFKDFITWLKDIFLIDSQWFKTSHAAKFYQQPEINILAKRGDNGCLSFRNTKPSYIDPTKYAKAIVSMLATQGQGITLWEKVQNAIQNNALGLEEATLMRFKNILNKANGQYEIFVQELISEYDEMMNRVNGWYKRKISLILFWIGFIVCIIGNVDTFQIVNILSKNEDYRKELVENAIRIAQSDTSEHKSTASLDSLKSLYNHINGEIVASTSVLSLERKYKPLKEMISASDTSKSILLKNFMDSVQTAIAHSTIQNPDAKWFETNQKIFTPLIKQLNDSLGTQYTTLVNINNESTIITLNRQPFYCEKVGQTIRQLRHHPSNLFGIIVTALALSLGAQFWFDLLKKLVALRGAGIKPEESINAEKKHQESQVKVDGNYVFSNDPFEIAISQNRKEWEALPGFVGLNKKDNSIEIAFDKIIPNGLKSDVEVKETNSKIPLHYSIRPAASTQCKINQNDYPANTLYIESIGNTGTITGLVKNKRTNRKAVLTAGHVVSSVMKSHFEASSIKATLCTGSIWSDLGYVSNKVFSPYFDMGLIDLNSRDFNAVGINIITVIEKIQEHNKTTDTYSIHTNRGIIDDCKLDYVDLYHSIRYEDTYILPFFKLLRFRLPEGKNTKEGDSGALITIKKSNEQNIPVAMHIAGSEKDGFYYSYALGLADIFEAFQLEIINNTNQ